MELNVSIATGFLNIQNFKDDLIEYKCLFWSKSCQRKFNEKSKGPFFSIYKFSNHDNDKVFLFLLQKGVYPYEYMDDWEKFIEATLPEKEGFYSQLNMEDIADADYVHAKRVCKDFEIKDLGKYHDFYVQSDALLLANVFENFGNICIKLNELDYAKFI